MDNQFIIIRKAKEHNLKSIDLDIPRDKLVVITGLSGSGKSSLAFDTIYAEGQRRYVESLSSYARQFLDQLQKPDIEHIEGLSPCIAIEQRTAGGSPRSTVCTQTEIYDYLRLLFARIGKVHCYKCKGEIKNQSAQEIVEQLLSISQDSIIDILAPIVKGKKGEYRDIFSQIKKSGFVRARVDNKFYELNEEIKLDKYKIHHIEVAIDKLTISQDIRNRLTDSVETALKIGSGVIKVILYSKKNKSSPENLKLSNKKVAKELIFSENYACPKCGISYAEVEPRIFSFNSPYGACTVCNGLGTKPEFDLDLIIPDRNKSINEGALLPWRRGPRGYLMYYSALLKEFSRAAGFDLDVPFNKLAKHIQKEILFGSDLFIWGKPYEGLVPHLERLFKETKSDYLKQEITRFMSTSVCPECNGSRLKKESLFVLINGMNIFQLTQMSINEAKIFFDSLVLNKTEYAIAENILKEINRRLQFCIDVGLDYLTLDRKSQTLSGGESQRIRLATQVGSGLTGVIYVLDEPSIGLHQRDNNRLIATLKKLRDLGNTLLIVEHDEATIRASDWVVDLGPGAGENGGKVLFNGPFSELMYCNESITAKYLRNELMISLPKERRSVDKNKLIEIIGACEHNLKKINVQIPLGLFVCITGVSGSGKSTLIEDILYKALSARLYNSKEKPGAFDKILGVEHIDKVIKVDQSPIGRTPRSNPATYSGVYGHVRELFSKLPEAKLRGFKPGRFSFNVKGGRCEACQGDGLKRIEMHFLPDVYVPCQVCKGKRFNDATLEVKYKGKSISDILEMSVEENLELFVNIPKIKNILLTLFEVGLGYIKLGQFATTLSGGEAQRVKLAAELSKRSTGKTVYILDEPTTGLHFADVDKLLSVLQRLVDKGNTCIIIEHNLDVIKSSDFVIDLGPEGGQRGGEVVFTGPFEDIITSDRSFTASYLKEALEKNIRK